MSVGPLVPTLSELSPSSMRRPVEVVIRSPACAHRGAVASSWVAGTSRRLSALLAPLGPVLFPVAFFAGRAVFFAAAAEAFLAALFAALLTVPARLTAPFWAVARAAADEVDDFDGEVRGRGGT